MFDFLNSLKWEKLELVSELLVLLNTSSNPLRLLANHKAAPRRGAEASQTGEY